MEEKAQLLRGGSVVVVNDGYGATAGVVGRADDGRSWWGVRAAHCFFFFCFFFLISLQGGRMDGWMDG